MKDITLWMQNRPDVGGFFHLFTKDKKIKYYLWNSDENGEIIDKLGAGWIYPKPENLDIINWIDFEGSSKDSNHSEIRIHLENLQSESRAKIEDFLNFLVKNLRKNK